MSLPLKNHKHIHTPTQVPLPSQRGMKLEGDNSLFSDRTMITCVTLHLSDMEAGSSWPDNEEPCHLYKITFYAITLTRWCFQLH